MTDQFPLADAQRPVVPAFSPDPDQLAALTAMQAGKSVYLTGGAGTGKSTLVKSFLAGTSQRFAILGTTGSASQLIGGMTVHKFFGLGSEVYQPGTKSVPDHVRQRLSNVDGILIDEVSMLRIDKLQEIRDTLFQCAKGFGAFAGFQVILSGDFAQLPPVMTDTDRGAIEAIYGTNQLFAFQSRHWKGLVFCNLKTLHRQAEDLEFAQILNDMRMGHVPDIALINGRVAPAPDGAVRLVAKNKSADAINGEMMRKIDGKHFRIEGNWNGDFQPRDMRVPPQLILKPGARVIICANDPAGQYVNGSTGTFVRAARDEDGTPVGHVQLDRGGLAIVPRKTWQSLSYDITEDKQGNAQVGHRISGEYRQLPILPGWAITVHRSQGMTIQNLHFDPEGTFETGQIYVALSRAPALASLTLARAINPADIRQDARVSEFQKTFSLPSEVEDEADFMPA
jgi:hypothetical protein